MHDRIGKSSGVTYLCTGFRSCLSGLATCSFTVLSILRSVGSTACGFLNSHLSAKQLLSIHFRNCLVHVGSVVEGNESVTLAASKSFRQTDFGTIQIVSVRIWIQSMGRELTFSSLQMHPSNLAQNFCTQDYRPRR